MSSPPISPEQLAALPPDVRAVIEAIIQHYERRVAEYEDRIAGLEAELQGLRKTPQNSSLPPSTQHPHAKPVPTKAKSNRKRGGQPGHARHERPLIPTEECDAVVPLKPTACRRCGTKLSGNDAEPLRHQVYELPEIKPVVTEYQQHRLSCPGCGETTCAALPVGVPRGGSGPKRIAFVALLMACFRQSKRRTSLFVETLLNVPCCPALTVKHQTIVTHALQPAYAEAVAALPSQPQLNGDESPTKEGPVKSWLWTFVAPAFTVFALRSSRAATAISELLGETFAGVMSCDRAKMDCLVAAACSGAGPIGNGISRRSSTATIIKSNAWVAT